MTEPTPTRAEVARYTAAGYDPGMRASHEGAWVSYADYEAMRERAEEAERAEATAWNDAIEAAEAAYAQGFAAIRALRRAAPTEGEA